jgi:hypothetical protein
MPTVFISHSVRGDAHALEILEAVRDGLRSKQYEVLVDLDVLKPGQQWAPELYLCLARCHAAVILLSPKAMASMWVRREVNILLWRRSLGAELEVLPVLIEDVTPERLASTPGLEELAPYQVAIGGADDADRIAQKIIDVFANREPPEDTSPMSKWVKDISDKIQAVRDQSVLAQAARDLNVGEDEIDDKIWNPEKQICHPGASSFLAHQFLAPERLDEEPPQAPEPPESGPYEAIETLAQQLSSDNLRRLSTLVAPTWVGSEAVRGLLKTATDTHTVVTLNATDPATAEQYINRAFCCAWRKYGVPRAVVARTGEKYIAEFVGKCDAAIRELAGVPAGTTFDDNTRARMRSDRIASRLGRRYLIVHPDAAGFADMGHVATALREIRDRYAGFRWLTIVLLTGPHLPSAQALQDWQLHDAIVLPPLGEDHEWLAKIMVENLWELPGRMEKVGGAREQ